MKTGSGKNGRKLRIFVLILGICPGFGGLLRYGRWTHLTTTLLFLWTLDCVLFINFQWTNFLPAGTGKWTFVLLFAVWLFLSAVSDYFSRKYDRIEKSDAKGELFLQTLTSYLKGNWQDAEKGAKKLLTNNARDVEAILLLATLYRHTSRYLEALEMLKRLDCLENSGRWYYEIYLEKSALQKALQGPEEEEEKEKEEELETPPSKNTDSPEVESTDLPQQLRVIHPDDNLETMIRSVG